MATMTFQINDASTEGTYPAVWVTITENADGTLSFVVTQSSTIIGDLRGLFFDVADESLILGSNNLTVTSTMFDPTKYVEGNDTVTNLGSGVNMNGLLGDSGGYDVGIALGTAGIGTDDIRTYTFTLSSNLRDLSLSDFAGVSFGARLTSVGELWGTRDLSSKILETTFAAIDAQDDNAVVHENHFADGNVLLNDINGLALTDLVGVTGWSGGALGSAIALNDAEGATLILNADGSYHLDASAADALSQGEVLVYDFTYDAKNINESTSWGTDTAHFQVTVVGENDGPVALDDHMGDITEDALVNGSVMGNDSDIDRLDTISVLAVNGVQDGGLGDLDGVVNGSVQVALNSGAIVTMGADGHFVYDQNGAFDGLNDGQTATDSFEYTLVDNHGATDLAVVDMLIHGVTDDNGGGGGGGGSFDFPSMHQALSNIVLYLDDGNAQTDLFKVKFSPPPGTVFDADDLNLPQWLIDHQADLGGNTNLVAFSIHAGTEFPLTTYDHPPEFPLGPGEGQLYIYGDGSYLPGEADYNPTVADNGPTAAMLAVGLTAAVIDAQTNMDVLIV